MREQPHLEPEPAWVLAAADQRAAELADRYDIPIAESDDVVICPLVRAEPGLSPKDRMRWERSCDNCEAYCRPGTMFFTGVVLRFLPGGQRILIGYGSCPDCIELTENPL